MDELKPCPFCGSKAAAFSEPYGCAHNGENVWRAWCGCSNDMCEAGFELFWYGDDLLDESDDDYTCNALMERAIKLWNRRDGECDREEILKIADKMRVRHQWLCAGDAIHARAIADKISDAIGEEK